MTRLKQLSLSLGMGGIVVFFLLFALVNAQRQDVSDAVQPRRLAKQTQWVVLMDDFAPQPLMGESVWYYNRLGGDRGQLDGWWDPGCPCAYPGGGSVTWGQGTATATITQTQGSEAWVGVWTSLNHVITENTPLNFSAIFPAQIRPEFQGNVTGLRLVILDGSGQLQVEFQAPDQSLVWSQTVNLTGGPQTLFFDNPPIGEIRNLNWLVKGQAGDFVVMDKVELEVNTPSLTTPERAFLWSYNMLLANWDAASGLTRDRANFPAGDFDNVSASGLQAATAVQAWQLGIISEDSATQIVSQTTAALLSLPDCHGLWPHFVTDGQITENTEWASLDTVIAMLALVEANSALGLQGNATAVIQAWQEIEWSLLLTPTNRVSHGFDYGCTAPLPHAWYDFGTETWLTNFGYAAATGNLAEMDATPPTFNGSGFIDELAWLFLPAPYRDRWNIRWNEYRNQAADTQIAYYQQPPHPCYAPDLFGLSAAEVPDPAAVLPDQIYQPFGVGGESPPNDGAELLGHAVLIPHYPAMISALQPQAATTFWIWLETQSLFTPLNNVESLMYVDEQTCETVVWNGLKGSWNLGLQTLGWGKYLLQADNPLPQAMWANQFLRLGYLVLTPRLCLYAPDASKDLVNTRPSTMVITTDSLIAPYPCGINTTTGSRSP